MVDVPRGNIEEGAGTPRHSSADLIQEVREFDAPAHLPAPDADGAGAYRVSAIVSTYNSDKFIRGCLEDLVGQTLFQKGQLEVIVVDACSEQDERAVVEAFRQRYGHIVYIRAARREKIYESWNRGLRLASGRYVTNANADDRHRRDALERLADCLDARPDVALVYADSLITTVPNDTFDETRAAHRFDWPAYSYEELEQRCFMGPHPMWRKALHDRYGYFDERYASAGDYEFWLRVGRTEMFYRYPDTLGLYYHNTEGVQYASGVSVREAHEILYRYEIPQRGIQPKSTPRVPVSVRELEALKRAGSQTVEHGSAGKEGESFFALVGAFQAHVGEDQWEAAAALALRATRDHPHEPYAWVMEAIACRMQRRWAEGLDAVRRSLRIEETPFAFVELMQFSLALGDTERARELADHVKARFPEWTSEMKEKLGAPQPDATARECTSALAS